jgi:hypothetical protein
MRKNIFFKRVVLTTLSLSEFMLDMGMGGGIPTPVRHCHVSNELFLQKLVLLLGIQFNSQKLNSTYGQRGGLNLPTYNCVNLFLA